MEQANRGYSTPNVSGKILWAKRDKRAEPLPRPEWGRGDTKYDATWSNAITAAQEYLRLIFGSDKNPAHVLMQGWLNPAKGYFCAVWSRRFLFRTFVASSEFGSAAMKTHTVTVCSSRPPPGNWFRARVFQKLFIAGGNYVWSSEFLKNLLPWYVRQSNNYIYPA